MEIFQHISDIRAKGWISRLPDEVRPFALLSRWDRPIGIWLLFWPAAMGLALGAHDFPPPILLSIFLMGSILLRGAGCTINDILDRNLDKQVARTAERPLANGTIDVRTAWVWLALQLFLGACLLFLLPPAVWAWGVAAVPLIVLYPFMKRVTWWPQAWLGMTFNWGVWLGVAATGEVSWAALWLYLGCVAWTIGYDTIYATQDKIDDALAGVKSTARLFGDDSLAAVAGLYTLAFILWLAAGATAVVMPWFYLGMAAVMGHMIWQMKQWGGLVETSRRVFVSNQWTGLALFLALVAGCAL
jgi:4-hydroxybenzoate polyprenyltransferase